MTARRVNRTHESYYGFSSDTKPITAAGNGDTFQELDTGAKFVFWDGAWEDDLALTYAFLEALKQQ